MGEVSNGPVSSLPGHISRVPEGAKCDAHPDRDAVRRVQGKQIPLAANITTCAKNVSMSIFGSPMKPTIQANVIGVVSKSSDLSLTGILKRELRSSL